MRIALPLVLALASTGVAADDWSDLVAAERDFAARAQVVGVRDAFVEAFADDNLGYLPGPVLARPAWQARPAPPITLEWGPSHAEIAASGDFGYTYGPWRRRPQEPKDAPWAHGHFFSVWERDASGVFRNVLDHGIDHGEVALATDAVRRGRAADAPRGARLPAAASNARLQALVQADRALAAALATPAGAAARRALATDDIAWLRSGALPAYGPAQTPDEAPFDAQQLATVRLAASGDLAVTSGWNGDPKAAQVYIRIWRHDGAAWRLAVDWLQRPPRG